LIVVKSEIIRLPLHASQIAYFECECKLAIYILCLAKNINIPLEENKHFLAGNVLHSILQDTFRWNNFPLVEHYYYNEKLSVEESLRKVFQREYDKWKRLFDLPIPSSLWMNDPSCMDDINEKITNQIDNLAKLASTLILEKSNEIKSLVIGEEFNLSHKLKHVLLVGNIDILARTENPNKFRLIELKTGKRYPSNETQLKIYGEVFRKSYQKYDLQLELWHPNYVKKISQNVTLSEDDEVLNKIEDLVERILRIEKESDLPPKNNKNTYYCERICKYCKNYIPEIFKEDVSTHNYW